MSDNEETYEHQEAASGASLSYPQQCSALRKNGHVLLKGFPCKIVEMSTSKTGKHGHAKVHLIGVDIFTGRKYEDLCPSTHNMDVPIVERQEYTLLDVDGDYLSMMTAAGDTKDDIRVPEGELGEQIRADFDAGKELVVSVLASMGTEAAIAVKEAPKGN